MGATDTALLYRIGGNIDDLKKSLSDGKNLIEGVNADVKKLSGEGGQGFKKLADGADEAVKPAHALHNAYRQIDGLLGTLDIHVREEVKALGELGEAAAGSGEGLGFIASAGLSVGAAIGGWKIGRWISDLGDLDTKIGDLTAKMLGWGDVAGELAANKLDVLAKASKMAGVTITDMELAQALLTGAVEANAKALDTSAARIRGWNYEIGKVKEQGNWEKVTADLKSQDFSLDELSKRYGISVDALQYFTKEEEKAATAIEEHNRRILDNLKNTSQAQKEATQRAEESAEAYEHVLLAQGKYTDVLSNFDAKLVADVKNWKDLGATAADIAVILSQPQGKIESITDALTQQEDVLNQVEAKWKALEAAQKKAVDDMAANALKSAQTQSQAFAKVTDDLENLLHRGTPGNEITYDLSSKSGFDYFRKQNPSAFIAPTLTPAYFQSGHTLQDAIAAGLIDMYAGFKGRAFASGTRNDPGGLALVGERGPEVVRLPAGSDVIPNHQIGGLGGDTYHITVNVQGHVTGVSTAQFGAIVQDALMKATKARGDRYPVTRR